MRAQDELPALVPGVRKIAVLRASRLGDLVVALPALAALRDAYPDAEITLLGWPWHVEFLARRPSPVDRVVVVPVAAGVREEPGEREDEVELADFFRRMAREEFDLGIQLHGGGRHSNPFVRRLGARLTAGLCAEDATPLDRFARYVYYQPEVLRWLEVVSLVGARPRDVRPSLAVTSADVDEAERALAGLPRPFALLHPGAVDPRRRWPALKFALVGDALARAGATVLVTGGPEEGSLVAEVRAAMREACVTFAGRLTLNGFAGLLSLADVVVANDTGPRHLAEAVGTPTVGVYWCGNVINAGPVTRGRHRPAISWRLECPVCGVDCTRDSCLHSASFVAEVEADEVIASALELLSLGREPATPRPVLAGDGETSSALDPRSPHRRRRSGSRRGGRR